MLQFAKGLLCLGIFCAATLASPARAETDVERLIAKAKLGSVDAQIELGMSYREGMRHMPDGSQIDKDLDQAERWLKEASKKNIQAKLWLGGLYASYDFPRRNDAAAAHIFGEVASSPEASREMATSAAAGLGELLYQECTGYLISLDCGKNNSSPFQDYKAAAYWFKKAADAGNTRAQFFLATMYESGRGVPQDYAQAAELYEQAEDAGHEEAAVMLAELYRRTKKLPVAYMWLNIAATENRAQAAERREELAKTMTQAQIEEGQRLTRNYTAAHASKSKDCAWYRC
ncbi:TPR repeat protein [Bradyrhizobium sp. USDA 4501]